jgi:hypothetical protein
MNFFCKMYLNIRDWWQSSPDWDQGMEDSLLRRIQSNP